MKYHVTYYYLATGMERNTDTRDYGVYEANDEQEAKEIVAVQAYPNDAATRTFFLGCLTARRVE